MVLLIDIGNTNIELALNQNGEMISSFRFNTDRTRTADEYYLSIRTLIPLEEIEGIMVASVVPNLTGVWRELFEKHVSAPVYVLEPPLKTKVALKVDNPREVGADLIADAAGVGDEHALIIDLGTATKYIYVKNRTIQGVIISPGLQASLNAMVSSTVLLPQIELKVPPKLLGNNTTHAMQSGIIHGMASEIDGMIDRIQEEVGCKEITLIATGGLSSLIVPLCRHQLRYEKYLIMDGLYSIYLLNKKEGLG